METEIGFVTSVSISYRIHSIEQVKGAVDAIVPVIELPVNLSSRTGGSSAIDMAATNVGSDRFIVGPRSHPDAVDLDAMAIRLSRDGETLHETTGGSANHGQWGNLLSIFNQIVDQGYTIPAGSLIISGALGKVHPGEAGRYTAEFGALGNIEFSLK